MSKTLKSLLAAAAAALVPMAAMATPTVINFNDLAGSITNSGGVALTNQYASQGFTFAPIAGAGGSITALSSAFVPGSVQAPCDSNTANATLPSCPNTSAADGFAYGFNFVITLDSTLQFDLLTLSITGTGRNGISVIVTGTEIDPNTGNNYVQTTLAPPGGLWSWVADQAVLTTASSIGDIVSVEFVSSGSLISIDNLRFDTTSVTPPTPTPTPTVAEPMSLALALGALGVAGAGLRRRRG